MNWMNLDLKAAEAASALAKEGEKLGLKKNEAEKANQQAASVLAHQGLSALFLHLKAEGPRPPKASKTRDWAEAIAKGSYGLLREAWPELEEKAATADGRLTQAGKLGLDLPRLIEAKQLLGQMLIYLRYHTKTFPGGKD